MRQTFWCHKLNLWRKEWFSCLWDKSWVLGSENWEGKWGVGGIVWFKTSGLMGWSRAVGLRCLRSCSERCLSELRRLTPPGLPGKMWSPAPESARAGAVSLRNSSRRRKSPPRWPFRFRSSRFLCFMIRFWMFIHCCFNFSMPSGCLKNELWTWIWVLACLFWIRELWIMGEFFELNSDSFFFQYWECFREKSQNKSEIS